MNRPHRADDNIVNFRMFRQRMLRHFLKDNTLDPDERGLLDEFDANHGELSAQRLDAIATDTLTHNGFTRRTRDAFREAGYDLVDLSAERNQRKSNVIAFRNRPEAS